jgi:Ni2+-binding GTPase involved in maturation of urease and hydrogenase
MPVVYQQLGGFLGAGKTTLVARLAREELQRGRRVAIVTNDQAEGLVDTASLQALGLTVAEVAGKCFCCHFGALLERIARLNSTHRPDVILAEPVGSCADLAATVLRPLRKLCPTTLKVRPALVLAEPGRVRALLGAPARSRLPAQAAYLWARQLEEADVIGLSKVDTLTVRERLDLLDLLRWRWPATPVVPVSATTGEGLDEVLRLLEAGGPAGQRALEIDGDGCASGEAGLGWLNADLDASDPAGLDLGRLALRLVEALTAPLAAEGAEVGHVKASATAGKQSAVANRTSIDRPVQLSREAGHVAGPARVVVNARACVAPERLRSLLDEALDRVGVEQGLSWAPVNVRCFRPARRAPTFRFAPGA